MPRRTKHTVAGAASAFSAGALVLALVATGACDGDESGVRATTAAGPDFDRAGLSPTVDHPFVAFASTRRAVFAGKDVDAETGATTVLRVESRVRDRTSTVGGVRVTVVDVADYENGGLVEKTEDYYAQHTSGDVAYMGERVDDYEDGRVTGHGGQWTAGRRGARPGVFMPAHPNVGDKFQQERAPGVAEDRSTVVAAGVAVTVPAGTFPDCIETEDVDPIGGATEHKFYCRGVGLVREVSATTSLDLVEYSAG